MKKQPVTTSYRWENAPLITRIDIRREPNGRAVAYIHAAVNPELHEKRLEVRAALRANGWGTLSDHRDGDFVLRVNGFTTDEELLGLLRNNGYVQGTRTFAAKETTKAAPQGLIESIRANSLRAAGVFYSIGNVIYLASGILRRRETNEPHNGQIRSAMIWGAGDALVSVIGGKDDGRQLTSLLTKLKRHYDHEGIDIPVTSAIHSETSTQGKSFGSKTYDFLHQYLNPIKCGTEVLAAFQYFKAGKEQGNVWKQRTAITFGLGFFASMVIPEKKIDAEKYESAGALNRLWMRIQSNPLSIGGISGYSNTILTSYGAFDESRRYRNPQAYPTLPDKTGKFTAPSKYYKLDYAAPAVMFFGNSLYAMSKKTTGGDIHNDAMVSDVYSIAAQVLNKLPEGQRTAAFKSTVKFLGERQEIKDKREQIMTRLTDEMAIQRQNPWFENIVLTPTSHKRHQGTHHATDAAAQPAYSASADAAIPAPPHQETAPALPLRNPDSPMPAVVGNIAHHAKGLAASNDAPFLQTASGR